MRWSGLLAFALGAVLAMALPALPGWGGVLALSLLAVSLLALRATRPVALAVLGLVWFAGHAQWQLDRAWPESRAGEVVTVTGTVTGLPEFHNNRARFLFRPDRGEDSELPARILVSWYRPGEYFQAGERWQLDLRLDPPHGRVNPGAFDYHRFLLAQRIGAQAGVVGQASRLALGGSAGSFGRLRQQVAEIVQTRTTSLQAAALKRALSVADRSALDSDTSDLLRRTGTAHLLAISGLHVGMVATLGGLLGAVFLAPLVLFHGRIDRSRLMLACGLLAATAYAALAGFTLPTTRALIMLGVVALAWIWRRTIQPGQALLAALVAVLLIDPLAPLATGFWLSFAAVAVLVWAFAWRPGRAGYLGGLVRAQLLIGVAMLPLNVGLFSQWMPVALIANLVAIPMVGLWILPALLAEVGAILTGLDWRLPGQLAEAGLIYLLGVLGWADGLAWGYRRIVPGPAWAIPLAMAGALWLIAPRGWPARWLGLALFLPLLASTPERLDHGQLELWLADVGNGQAVIVRTSNQLLVYDTGPGDGAGRDQVERILVPMLERLDRRAPARIIVSHAHRGHAGGLASLAERFPETPVLAPHDELGEPCQAGMAWSDGPVRFELLHPHASLPYLEANSSCVLLISSPGGSVLLTGGIDAAVEQRLLALYPELRADVLVLSASGHRRATSEAWLDRLEPELALASAARHDRFGRPHQSVRSRLDARQIELATTGQCGAVRLRIDPEHGPQWRSLATLERRWWRLRTDCP